MSFKNGVNSDKSGYGQGIKFINVLEIFNNDFITHDLIVGKVSLSEKEVEKNVVNSGDLLFNRTSEVPEEIGMTAVYVDEQPVVFGGFVIKGTPINELLDIRFKAYCFYSSAVRKQIIAKGQGAVRSNIGQKDLEKVYLPLPPLPEQQKIADILSTWDAAIAKTEALIAQKRQLEKGLMQQLLTGQKRFAEFVKSTQTQTTKLGEVPEDWEVKKLGEMGTVLSGLTYSPKDVVDEGILVLRSSNIQGGQLLYSDNVFVVEGKYSYNQVQEGDILICVRNGSRNLIGKNTLITSEAVGSAFGAFMSVFRSDSNSYVFQLFKTKYYSREIMRNLGATINSINGSHLKAFHFPFPTDGLEQQKIASVLSAADAELAALQDQLAQLRRQKKGLMQKLLTGQVRVRVPKGETATLRLP